MRVESSNTTSDAQRGKLESPPDQPSDKDSPRPSDYYYDDATGYEIYEEDDEEEDDQSDTNTRRRVS